METYIAMVIMGPYDRLMCTLSVCVQFLTGVEAATIIHKLQATQSVIVI